MSIEDIKTNDGDTTTVVPSSDVTALNEYSDFTISEDNRGVLGEAGIVGVDKSGNLVNEANEIVVNNDIYNKEDFDTLSKDDFMKKYFEDIKTGDAGEAGDGDTSGITSIDDLVAGTAITIGDDDYTMDGEGNAVKADGTKIEKADLAKMLEDGAGAEEETDFMASLSKIDGYDLQDENGNALEFEATPDGVAKRTQLILDNEVEARTSNAIEQFLSSNPELQAAHNHLRVHGSLDSFANTVDYSKVELDKDDKDQLREYVIKGEVALGKSRAEAENYAKFVESNNKLFDTADTVVKNFAAKQVDELKEAEVRETSQKEAQDKYFNDVQTIANNVVKDGKILDYKLPLNFKIKDSNGATKTVPRAEFTDYLFKPVTPEGHTQAQLKRAEYSKSIDNLIFDDLLMFLGMDTNQLTLAEKEDKRVKTIIRRKNETGGAAKIKIKAPIDIIDDIK